MEDVVRSSPKATMLARSLATWFGRRLLCVVIPDDGQPNAFSIDGIDDPTGESRIRITVRQNHRTEEGLVHELLHANLIASGYPIFWINEEVDSPEWHLAAGIINCADHAVMEPVFVSFGYCRERFLGPSKPLRPEHEQLSMSLQGAAVEFSSPTGYVAGVAKHLRRNGIPFLPLYITNGRPHALGALSTQRLCLRPFTVEDAADWHGLETDAEVKRFLNSPSKRTVEDYQHSIANSPDRLWTSLAVISADTGAFMGRCGFTEYREQDANSDPVPGEWEINVVLRPSCWNHGYAAEIVAALIPHGFARLGCERILAVVDAENSRSLRLCERLQMRFYGNTARYGRPARIYVLTRPAD